jgi:predicted enzyme related to lactoylglutathione lyase
MSKMNPVVHFEMPAEDTGRMRKFYEAAFGWQTQQLGKDMGEYVVVTTSETDENRMVKKPGTINGGFYKKTDDPISQYPSVVVAVDDINDAMKKVKDAGGKVIGGQKGDGTPDEIPGIGLFASIIDTEGNRISILQPKKM